MVFHLAGLEVDGGKARDVRGRDVGRELYAPEGAVQGSRQGGSQGGLAHAGHVLDEHVALAQQGDEHQVHHVLFSHDDLAHILPKVFDQLLCRLHDEPPLFMIILSCRRDNNCSPPIVYTTRRVLHKHFHEKSMWRNIAQPFAIAYTHIPKSILTNRNRPRIITCIVAHFAQFKGEYIWVLKFANSAVPLLRMRAIPESPGYPVGRSHRCYVVPSAPANAP